MIMQSGVRVDFVRPEDVLDMAKIPSNAAPLLLMTKEESCKAAFANGHSSKAEM